MMSVLVCYFILRLHSPKFYSQILDRMLWKFSKLLKHTKNRRNWYNPSCRLWYLVLNMTIQDYCYSQLSHRRLCRVKNMLAGQWQPPKKSQGRFHCPASIFFTIDKHLWVNMLVSSYIINGVVCTYICTLFFCIFRRHSPFLCVL